MPSGVAPFPILAGMSRKSMFGAVTGRATPQERVAASVAGAVCAAERGASIIRVHDVAETVDALKVWAAVRDATRASELGQTWRNKIN
jgi:dihydropteroate synthase